MTRLLLSLFAALSIIGCGGGSSSDSGEFEYVAMGASDAVGIGATPLENGYVYLIHEALEADGRDAGLLNLGIPGLQADEMRKVELPIAVEDEPELVTIFTGPNDIIHGVSAEDFENDVNEILSELAAKTGAVVVIATIPDFTRVPRFQTEPDRDVTPERINTFNQIIRDAAARSGAHIADLAADPVRDSDVSSEDGFHPNDQGHQRLAQLFLAVIWPLLPPA